MDGVREIPIRECRECGQKFRPARQDQVYHSNACRHKWHRRAQVRGGQAYEALYRWRRSRGKKGTLSELQHIVDTWISDDRENNRLPFGGEVVGSN